MWNACGGPSSPWTLHDLTRIHTYDKFAAVQLTRKQEKVLHFIRSFLRDARRPPTIREIAANFRYKSVRTVQVYLETLERKGAIRRAKGLSRGIELSEDVLGIPIMGRVPAGTPFLAEENIDSMLDLSIDYFRAKDRVYALRVVGDSMKDAGIVEGDLVIVRRQQVAATGDIVVALIDGEATVKRYEEKRGGKVLVPANPAYSPIPLGANASLTGKVIGVIRRYGR